MFSMISQINAVKLCDAASPSLFSKTADVLSDEQRLLKDFAAFAEGITGIVYPNQKSLAYLRDCLAQYHMPDFTSRWEETSPDSIQLEDQIDTGWLISEAGTFEGTLKHYYPDYKNYYYLPAEDYAVYKSIGEAVDPEARRKATKETAYTKKAGTFVPAPSDASVPVFKKTYYDTDTYCLLNDVDAHVLLHILVNK